MSVSVDKLFASTTLAKLLRFLLINHDQEYKPEELARQLRVKKDVIKKELSILKKVGVVKQSGKAKAARYSLDETSKYAFGLYELLVVADSSRDDEILEQISKVVKNLDLLVLTGVFTDNKHSDTDILIVAKKANDKKLSKAIEELEAMFARELRYVVLDKYEFELRFSMQDKLVKNIFDYPHKILFKQNISII